MDVFDVTNDCVVARCNMGNTLLTMPLESVNIPKNYLVSTTIYQIKKNEHNTFVPWDHALCFEGTKGIDKCVLPC